MPADKQPAAEQPVDERIEGLRPLVILMSRGGQGRVAMDAVMAAGIRPAGMLDDHATGEVHGIPVLGKPDEWPRFAADVRFLLALGSPLQRLSIGRAMIEGGAEVASAIHPGAYLSPLATVGRGLIALHGVTVHPDAQIGDFCILNANASIDHDCRLEDGVNIGPGVTFPGGVTCGEGATVGAGVVCVPGRSIGRYAVIGSGAVVTKDVADDMTVAGNPARPLERG